MTCLTPGCQRAPIPSASGIVHAHCLDHERRLLAEAFGPIAWQDRAATNTLPPLAVGGIPTDSRDPGERLTVPSGRTLLETAGAVR